jgi:hypothetical protein
MPPEGITNLSGFLIRHTKFSACFCRQREVVLLSWRGCWWGGRGPPTELANMKLRHQHPFLEVKIPSQTECLQRENLSQPLYNSFSYGSIAYEARVIRALEGAR